MPLYKISTLKFFAPIVFTQLGHNFFRCVIMQKIVNYARMEIKMKKLGLILLVLTLSTSSFAFDCSVQAKKVAKMNLDQVAIIYGFESSDVIDSAVLVRTETVKVTVDITETLSVFSVAGNIYKGNYTVTVTLDSFCGTRNVNIHDDSTI